MSVTRAFAAGLVQDARYAVRMLRRHPDVALVAMLSSRWRVGIGATTTLFSVAYGVLLKPLPWPEAGRLVRVTEARGGREARVAGTMSNGPYLVWAADRSTIDAIGGWLRQAPSTMAIAGGEPSLVQTAVDPLHAMR